MKALEDLRAEHEGILTMLEILEKMSERIISGEKAPVEHLKQVLRFLEVFADKCHHGKEEGILFPAMEEAGVPKAGGPLGAMLSEHDKGRRLIGEIKNLLDAHARGETASLVVLTNPVLQYVDLLRSHIWKENNVLFVMAEKNVAEEKQQEIGEKFEKFEEEIIGPGTHESFRAMMDELSRIYL